MPTSTPRPENADFIPLLKSICEHLDDAADLIDNAGNREYADRLVALAGILERSIANFKGATEDDAFIEMSRRAAFWRAAAIHHGASPRSYSDYRKALDA